MVLDVGVESPVGEYFAEVRDKYPGALESQWIPTDEQLWHPSRYRDFLAARRDLLATAANSFLDQPSHGTSTTAATLQRLTVVAADEPDDDDRATRWTRSSHAWSTPDAPSPCATPRSPTPRPDAHSP
jgi:hypothetical protein